MKAFTPCVLLVGMLVMLAAPGCKKSSNPVTAPAPTIDQSIVGVWYSPVDNDGVEVKGDGTWLPLMVDANNKLQYDAVPAGITYTLVTPQPGAFTLTIKGKSPLTGNDTTVVSAGTYVLSNTSTTGTPATMTVTLTTGGVTQQITYTRAAIGTLVTTITTVDAMLIGVWYSSTDQNGIEIKNDGSWLPLTVDANHKLQYETIPAGVSYKLTTPQAGSFILTIKGKSLATGNDTTIVATGTYVVGSNNTSLTVTLISGGETFQSTYARSAIGAVVARVASAAPRRFVIPSFVR